MHPPFSSCYQVPIHVGVGILQQLCSDIYSYCDHFVNFGALEVFGIRGEALLIIMSLIRVLSLSLTGSASYSFCQTGVTNPPHTPWQSGRAKRHTYSDTATPFPLTPLYCHTYS